eukprot:jgi/Psemu1/30731/gm1.30731_g
MVDPSATDHHSTTRFPNLISFSIPADNSSTIHQSSSNLDSLVNEVDPDFPISFPEYASIFRLPIIILLPNAPPADAHVAATVPSGTTDFVRTKTVDSDVVATPINTTRCYTILILELGPDPFSLKLYGSDCSTVFPGKTWDLAMQKYTPIELDTLPHVIMTFDKHCLPRRF